MMEMSTQDCIFCKIVKKEIPAMIVHQSDNAIGFLDIAPRSKGMCLVVPKQHFDQFDENLDIASKTFDDALTVAKKIKQALNPELVFISIMQGQVPHFHIRVYPVYKDQIPLIENKPIKINEEELNSLANKIKNVDVDWRGRAIVEVEEEKKEQETKKEDKKRTRDKEEIYWLKRSMEIG